MLQFYCSDLNGRWTWRQTNVELGTISSAERHQLPLFTGLGSARCGLWHC